MYGGFVYQAFKSPFRINNINGINKIYSEKNPGIIKPALNWLTRNI
jgi:hypothetical protein